jgi:hypothetical protein
MNSLRQYWLISAINFKLLKRFSLKGYYAYLMNLLIAALYALVILLFITELDNEDIQLAPSIVMMHMSILYIIIAVSSLMYRYSDFTRCILPGYLIIFPLTHKNIYYSLVWDHLFNLNSAGFLVLYLCVGLKISPYPASISILLAMATVLAFMICCVAWITNIYIIAAKLFQKYGNIVAMISILLLGPFNYILSKFIKDKSPLEFNKVPVIGWPGLGMYGIQNESYRESLFVTVILLLLAFIGIVVGIVLLKKQKYSFYSWGRG